MIADYSVKVWRIIGSPRYPASEQRLRDDAIEAYERCYYPWGIGRHFSAIIASGSLAPLRPADHRADRGPARQAPTSCSGRSAAGWSPVRSAGARLVLFDGMGHDLPEELWDQVIGELTTSRCCSDSA